MESEKRICSNVSCKQEETSRWRKTGNVYKCNACYEYFIRKKKDRVPKKPGRTYVCTQCNKTIPDEKCRKKTTNPVCTSCYFKKRRERKKGVIKNQLARERKGEDLNDKTVSKQRQRFKNRRQESTSSFTNYSSNTSSDTQSSLMQPQPSSNSIHQLTETHINDMDVTNRQDQYEESSISNDLSYDSNEIHRTTLIDLQSSSTSVASDFDFGTTYVQNILDFNQF